MGREDWIERLKGAGMAGTRGRGGAAATQGGAVEPHREVSAPNPKRDEDAVEGPGHCRLRRAAGDAGVAEGAADQRQSCDPHSEAHWIHMLCHKAVC